MRIIFDILRDGLSAINTASSQLAKAQQQVSTGRRLAGVGDDPLAAQQAVLEHSTLGALDAYTRTSDSAAARLASADNVLTGYTDKVTSAISTALGAQGSQATPASRAAAAQTILSLRDGLLSDLNTTFNGTYLFSGTQAGSATYTQVAGTWTYGGDNATTRVEVEQGRTVAVSFDGQAIAQGSDATDIFTALDTLATDITNGNTAGISAGIAALQRGFDRAQRAQASVGSDEQGVDAALARLGSQRVASETRRSKLEDANLAEAVSRMTQADTAYKAALGAVSTVERQSLLDYLR